MEKSIKILIMIELQKKVLNTLVYQYFDCKNYYPQVFLEGCKYIVKE